MARHERSIETKNIEMKTLEWERGEDWHRKYRYAGFQPLITDHDEWTAGWVAQTYFDQSNIGAMFHLTKEALIVPVQSPYVKEDQFVRAHLFTVFVGLVCYLHIRRQLPESWTHEEIKDALKQLDMVVALKDETVQFELANLDNTTRTVLDARVGGLFARPVVRTATASGGRGRVRSPGFGGSPS